MPPKKRPPAKKIYVVEDDPIILDYLETVLKSLKYKVSSSQSGEGALEGIARNGSDLVLLDVMLPDVDGITLCRHLRQDRRTRDIPVIMLTCLTDSSTIRNAYAHGAVDFIPKPFSQAILKEKIKKALLTKHPVS